jgi:probable F420-dependent oxidoreductase
MAVAVTESTRPRLAISLGMLNPSAWADVTEEADRLGFESVWVPEHLVLPITLDGSPFAGDEHPPIPPELPVFDAFTYKGFLAGRTERTRFCTHVYNLGLRHPFVSARAVTTLDVVSGGRAMFGIGASWLRPEWEAVGLDFDTRGRRVDEALEVCLRLWTEREIEHHGEFFDFDPVMFEPKPVQQPRPPVHVGGDGPAALRRAATMGDGWVPMNHDISEIPAAAARLAALREAKGIDGTVEITFGATPETEAELESYAAAGVHRLIVRPWQRTSDAIESLRRYAALFLDPSARPLA